MSVRPYSPEGKLASFETGLVLFNHMGSCVLGDTGRDAQHLANTLGVHVVAADRPGSGFAWRGRGPRLAADYIGALSKLAARRIMPEVEALGLRQVIVAGRSAGGLAALGATCTEQLPTRAVHAQEAVGWHAITVDEGRQTYDAYRDRQAILIGDELHSLVRPDPTDQIGFRRWLRLGTIVLTAPTDIKNNGGVWSQDLALTSATHIAARMPGVRADIFFAQHSMVAEPDEIVDFRSQLEAARQHGSPAPREPFRVAVVPNTVHSSFDQRDFSAGLIGTTLASVLTLPPPA